MSADRKKSDLISERVVLGFLLQHGSKALTDIQASLKTEDFYHDKNQSIFSCLADIIAETDAKTVTIDAVLTTAKKLNLEKIITVEDIKFLKFCKQQNLSIEELPQFVKHVKFWSIVRQLDKQCSTINHYLGSLSGQETLSEVVAQTEESILGFIPSLLQEDEILELTEFSNEYIPFLGENPVQSIGLASGFPKWDECIGGGLRRGSVNLVGSRAKCGKSFFCLNVTKNLVERDIPVLYLDTELNKNVQSARWTSLISKIDTLNIETGQFTQNPHSKKTVEDALEKTIKYPFDYVTVAGKTPQEMISVMRRWISKRVGRDANGNTNDCVIILDYLKTMDLKDLGHFQEHQYLGDVITKLHNFTVKYDLPILATIQLNRDGISKDSSDSVSASDRLLWLCSSLTFLKNKTPEDISSGDSLSNGQKKMIVIDTRFGEGMDPTTTYINVITNLQRAELKEGNFNYENTEQVLDDILDNDETII